MSFLVFVSCIHNYHIRTCFCLCYSALSCVAGQVIVKINKELWFIFACLMYQYLWDAFQNIRSFYGREFPSNKVVFCFLFPGTTTLFRNLTFVCPCIFSIIVNDDQKDTNILTYLFIPNQLYMFRAMSSAIIRST